MSYERQVASFTSRIGNRMRDLDFFPDGELVRVVSVSGGKARVTQDDWGHEMLVQIRPFGATVGVGEEVPMWSEAGNRLIWWIRGRFVRRPTNPWVLDAPRGSGTVVQWWEYPCYNNYATLTSKDTGFSAPNFTEVWATEISRSQQVLEAFGLVIYEITQGEHAGKTVCVVAIGEENTPGENLGLTSLRLRALDFDTGEEVWTAFYSGLRGWGRNSVEGQGLYAQLLPDSPEPKKRALIVFGQAFDPAPGSDTCEERILNFDPDTGLLLGGFPVFGNSYVNGCGAEENSYYQNGCHSSYYGVSPYTFPYHRVRRNDNELTWAFGFYRTDLYYSDWGTSVAESQRLHGPTPADKPNDSVFCWRSERKHDYSEWRSSVYCLHRTTGATKWEYRVSSSGTASGVILGCSEEFSANPGGSNTSMVMDSDGNIYFPLFRWTTSGLATTWESRIISLDKDGVLRFDTLIDSIVENHPGPTPEPATSIGGFYNHYVLALCETEFGSRLIAIRPSSYAKILNPTATAVYPVQTVGLDLAGAVVWTLDHWGGAAGSEFGNTGIGRFVAGGQSTSSPWIVLRRRVTPEITPPSVSPQYAIGIIDAMSGSVMSVKNDENPFQGSGACVAVGAGSVVLTRHDSDGGEHTVELVKYQ